VKGPIEEEGFLMLCKLSCSNQQRETFYKHKEMGFGILMYKLTFILNCMKGLTHHSLNFFLSTPHVNNGSSVSKGSCMA
jgi:hypothetical protein